MIATDRTTAEHDYSIVLARWRPLCIQSNTLVLWAARESATMFNINSFHMKLHISYEVRMFLAKQ